MSAAFAHLHVRSGFSYGFGVAMPEELLRTAASMGMNALALTDRDGLYGVPRFLETAAQAGVSPVVGAEVSMEDGGHIVLLAEGIEGYRSLCRLITVYRCSSEDRRRPQCSLETLLEHGEGVVCLTGAVPFGLLPRLVLSGQRRRAEEVLGVLRGAFGREGVYVELSDDGTAGGRRRLERVAAFARGVGAPLVATGEVVYLRTRDHRLHEVLVAASHLCTLPGPGYRPTDQLYLKPPEKAAERTLLELVVAGARKRYGGRKGGGPTTEEVRIRLKRELSCINALGFAPYFLIAHEAAGIAREKGIPVTGRGSAANSLVSYCLV